MKTPKQPTPPENKNGLFFSRRVNRPRGVPRLRPKWVLASLGATLFALGCHPDSALANTPGGIVPGGLAVTVHDNGDGTVTMANGIASIQIVTATSRIRSIQYTFTSGGKSYTVETDNPNAVGRENYYYGGFYLGSGSQTYSATVDPNGNSADVKMLTDPSGTNGVFETHYTMLRGSPGFYTTAIETHRSQDAAVGLTAFGVVSVVPGAFNWLSQDPFRDLLVGVEPSYGAGTLGVPGAAHEMSIEGDGNFAGRYADKFFYGQDHGDLKGWGWSSVTPNGLNYGRWMMTNLEFSDGGPLKRDVFSYVVGNLNNSILTGELGQGSDGNFTAGEPWTKVVGPFFNYLNHIDQTDPAAATQDSAANALFADANAQDAAEKSAWPYSWFANANYPLSSGRGTVTGKLTISDSGDRNPPVAGTVVGLIKQPITSTGTYDFSKWYKPYQYFTTTDSSGNYTFNDVRADTGYTLWAYGPGEPGTFQSQAQTGGNAPLELTLPSPTQSIDVTGGTTTTVPTMTWNVKRVGSTVFEIGVPDRKADEFRHGEDFWEADLTPNSGGTTPAQRYPDGIWGAQPLFGNEFPTGVVYDVGTSRWSTDWNYTLPSLVGLDNAYHTATATIHFNLAATPPVGAQASFFMGIAGDDHGALVISVNGTSLSNNANVTSAPTSVSSSTTYSPAYQDDSSTHLSNHGPYCDERFTFPGNTFLHAGDNTITINMNAAEADAYLMVDFLRLELSGYIPPPPSFVRVFTGNNRNLVSWPVVPGATRYALLRSTTSGSGYTTLAPGILGSVSGDDASIMTYADTTAVNNTQYYYVVQSLNPTGSSANSVETPAKPLSTKPTSAPATPTGVSITASGHHSATVGWTASTGADYYKVYRTTLYDDGTNHSNDLRKNLLADTLLSTTTSFTDPTPSDGRTYAYSVVAVNAAGASAESTDAQVTPLPAVPGAVGSLAASRSADKTSITLSWTAPSGGGAATGFAIYYATSQSGPFTWPYQYVGTTPALTTNVTNLNTAPAPDAAHPFPVEVSVSPTQTYYFQVMAVNAKGASTPVSVTSAP